MNHGIIHVQIEGITHEAQRFELHSLLALSCETRPHPEMWIRYRKPADVVDVGLVTPVDCMACLIRMVPR